MGASQAGPSHLLQAAIGRPDSLGLLADFGSNQVEVRQRLRNGLEEIRSAPLPEKPPFDNALEAALLSAQIHLKTAGAEFFREGGSRPVMRLVLSIIDRHADRDPVCNAALASVTLACLSGEMPRSFTRTGPTEPAEPAQEATPKAPPRAQSSSYSHLARDAAEVEAAVGRAFRSLSAEAIEGEIDPVIGREAEIDRIIRALMRRRKRSMWEFYGLSSILRKALSHWAASQVLHRQVRGRSCRPAGQCR